MGRLGKWPIEHIPPLLNKPSGTGRVTNDGTPPAREQVGLMARWTLHSQDQYSIRQAWEPGSRGQRGTRRPSCICAAHGAAFTVSCVQASGGRASPAGARWRRPQSRVGMEGALVCCPVSGSGTPPGSSLASPAAVLQSWASWGRHRGLSALSPQRLIWGAGTVSTSFLCVATSFLGPKGPSQTPGRPVFQRGAERQAPAPVPCCGHSVPCECPLLTEAECAETVQRGGAGAGSGPFPCFLRNFEVSGPDWH